MEEIKEILQGVRLLDPQTDSDTVVDVAVGESKILWIREASGEPSGLWLLPGLVDMHVHLRTPGYEGAETLQTGLRAAIAGGVTCIGMMPNTSPPLDTLEAVLRVREAGEFFKLASIEPVPCVTLGRSGEKCVDLERFASSGITSFTDDGSPVESDEALLDAFHRIASFDGVVIEHPEVSAMAFGGAVNQGRASIETGVAGIPESAEYLDVERCIAVLRESGGKARLHLTHLSSPESIRLAHKATMEGLRVTCDVTPHHIALNEESVIELGSLAKMNPPLRSEESRRKVVEMIADGKVSAIASDHAPHTIEKKNLPLTDAAFGITGLETLLPLTVSTLSMEAGMAPLEIVRLLTSSPASVLNIEPPKIAVGDPLNMVLFNPKLEWTYTRTFSSSSNTPFLGRKLTGKVLRVWFRRELFREGEFV